MNRKIIKKAGLFPSIKDLEHKVVNNKVKFDQPDDLNLNDIARNGVSREDVKKYRDATRNYFNSINSFVGRNYVPGGALIGGGTGALGGLVAGLMTKDPKKRLKNTILYSMLSGLVGAGVGSTVGYAVGYNKYNDHPSMRNAKNIAERRILDLEDLSNYSPNTSDFNRSYTRFIKNIFN